MNEATYQVGAAKIDITPDFPVRLSGYGARSTESEDVEQRIWAKALAIRDGDGGPALLMTVENCGVPNAMTEEVAAELKRKAGIARERLVICSTHTHSAPCLSGVLPTLFGQPIPDEHQANIDRYTRELTGKLKEVAFASLADLRPGFLDWGEGRVEFANNRRTPGGATDHALPMLRVTDADGKLRAILVSYACHCTTLGGDFNAVCGDWAGYAQGYIEADCPGAIAMVAIGCAGDANPAPRPGLNFARQHGHAIAAEVNRLLGEGLAAIHAKLSGQVKRIDLPFDTLPPRSEWEDRVKQGGAIGYHAQAQLDRLNRGEALPTTLSYPVQTWHFGDELAIVFLPGEVVVDYSIRLKKECDPTRLWVNAYCNDVPCYIPSRRILKEGGYEGEGAMIYYDRPTRFAPAVEEMIISTVHQLLPEMFRLQRS
ncbi:MAG: neutral/alkaline non-lysosomal ceramidase N-terminal domain-containing protein [Candidatus Poribacteria bacterium]|nr:neutral/alkaline non-lysosomal ceramidase N-terminal domain-containing protein [Candidatus Poribacteria bacterium]